MQSRPPGACQESASVYVAVQQPANLVLAALHQVAVPVERDADGRVAEHDAERLRVGARGDEERRTGVAALMHGDRLEARITDARTKIVRHLPGGGTEDVLTAERNMFQGSMAGIVVSDGGSIGMGAPIPRPIAAAFAL